MAEQFAPDADIEVRMDSKLVVEQMSGRWKIKHPDMKPLAMEANRLAPFGTTYTWVPREQNTHADRLANEALDGKRNGVSTPDDDAEPDDSLIEEIENPAPARSTPAAPSRGWAGPAPPTTLVLVRHGVTPHTVEKRSPAGWAATTPGSATRAGRRSAPPPTGWRRSPSGSTRSSPRRCAGPASPPRSSPRCSVAPVEVEPGFAEMEFGAWDGLTFAEVARAAPRRPRGLAGLARPAPGGGESFQTVRGAGPRGAGPGAARRTPAGPWSWSAT